MHTYRRIAAPPADQNWTERETIEYLGGILDHFDGVCVEIERCCETFKDGLDGWLDRHTRRHI